MQLGEQAGNFLKVVRERRHENSAFTNKTNCKLEQSPLQDFPAFIGTNTRFNQTSDLHLPERELNE